MKRNERIIRNEPGEYTITARFQDDGTFDVTAKSVRPITLTVRVEDIWEYIPENLRRFVYSVHIERDVGGERKSERLENVAPDARIFLDFDKSFIMRFL